MKYILMHCRRVSLLFILLAGFQAAVAHVLPGNTPHFHWARSGEYITQVTAVGPLGIKYVDPADDPRNQQH